VHGYFLLTAFDLALGLMLIVGTTRDPKDPNAVDPRAAWFSARIAAALIQGAFLGVVAAFLLIPLGMPAFISGMEAAATENRVKRCRRHACRYRKKKLENERDDALNSFPIGGVVIGELFDHYFFFGARFDPEA
jgi:hypothetical protein